MKKPKNSDIVFFGVIASVIFALTANSIFILLLELVFTAIAVRLVTSWTPERTARLKSRISKYPENHKPTPGQTREPSYRRRAKRGQQSANELDWMGRRGMLRYIPFRYQALVAQIVAGLLCFHIFQTLTVPESAGKEFCGSLVRPVINWEDGSFVSQGLGTLRSWKVDVIQKVGWFWNIGSAYCPDYISVRLNGMFLSFIALAICGIIMRRAIKREEATQLPTRWGQTST